MASTVWMTGAALVLGFGLMGQETVTQQPVVQSTTPRVIDLSHPTKADLQQLVRGEMQPGSTVKVPAGTELPIAIGMRGDVAGVVEPSAPVRLKARRDVWLRFTGEEVVASLDGVHWKPFTRLFTGALSFGLTADDESGTNLRGNLGLELRVRVDD